MIVGDVGDSLAILAFISLDAVVVIRGEDNAISMVVLDVCSSGECAKVFCVVCWLGASVSVSVSIILSVIGGDEGEIICKGVDCKGDFTDKNGEEEGKEGEEGKSRREELCVGDDVNDCIN